MTARRLSHSLAWPLGSVLAGSAGTAVLTLAYAAVRRVSHTGGPLDYDDSLVPGEIVANIVHLPSVSEQAQRELGEALRWSYGSAFGIWHGVLRRRLGEPGAILGFAGSLITVTLTMFPLLGHTPPPWRWPRGYLLTSLATHAAYATTVAVVDDRLGAQR